LASDGPYRTICEELIKKYPNLQHKDFKHTEAPPGARSTFRLVAIDFQSSGSQVGATCDTMQAVQQCLQATPTSNTLRRLYLLEGQSPDLFSILGFKLKVDPQVFMRHQRTALCDSEQNGGNTPYLASLVGSNSSYVLDFFDVRYFPQGFRSRSLECSDSHRHVALPSKDGRFEEIGIVCNKATF
jgi:hypothetical protein